MSQIGHFFSSYMSQLKSVFYKNVLAKTVHTENHIFGLIEIWLPKKFMKSQKLRVGNSIILAFRISKIFKIGWKISKLQVRKLLPKKLGLIIKAYIPFETFRLLSLHLRDWVLLDLGDWYLTSLLIWYTIY